MYSYLLVDDEPLIRKGTLKKIASLHLPLECAFEAENGQQAITYLLNHSVDFIITDMDMPEIDGPSFLDYLKKTYPELPIIVISGYQNFDYVQKAIQSKAVNYILKPFSKEMIKASLLDVIHLLKKKTAEKTEMAEKFLFTLESDETLEETSIYQQLSQQTGSLQILISETKGHSVSIQHLIANAAFHTTYPNYEHLHFFLLKTGTVQEALMQLKSEDTLSALSKPFLLDNRFLDKQMKAAYQEVLLMMNSRTSISEAFLSMESKIDPFVPDDLMINKYMYMIETGQTKKFKQGFIQELDMLYFNKNYPLAAIKEFGLRLIEQSKQFLDMYYGTHTNHTYPAVYLDVMYRIFNYDKVKQHLLHFLGNIADSLSYERLYSSHDLVTNVRDYIENHFTEPLTLAYLADLFFVNSSYLSSVFKERTGMKYVDYLNHLRIEKAKELLIKTTANADYIAKKIGYDNGKYFFKVFKKFTDETPEQFRTRIKKY